MQDIALIAKQLVAKGKGIFAADESLKTVEKRFAPIHLANTPENRHNFREMFLTTKGAGAYISGVILFDETIRDSINAKRFVDILQEEHILAGIKVDGGTYDMPTSPSEKLTAGLEGLQTRLSAYKAMGAVFCKWRAVITISKTTPTKENIQQNAKDMAHYAKLCQEQGLVPMVEPEILIDGDHTREEAGIASEKILTVLFEELQKNDVLLEGLILKTSMVIQGKQCHQPETPTQVAQATIDLFTKVIPHHIAGVVFLSGGQSEIQATENLNAMHQFGTLPWPLTFSYSRALEESAILAWQGKKEHIPTAQKIYLHRAKMNSLASLGTYSPERENELGS